MCTCTHIHTCLSTHMCTINAKLLNCVSLIWLVSSILIPFWFFFVCWDGVFLICSRLALNSQLSCFSLPIIKIIGMHHYLISSLHYIDMVKVCWSLIFSKKTFHSIDAYLAVLNDFHLCSNVYYFDSVYTKFICFPFCNIIKPKGRLVMDSRFTFLKIYITSVHSDDFPSKCCFGLALWDVISFCFRWAHERICFYNFLWRKPCYLRLLSTMSRYGTKWRAPFSNGPSSSLPDLIWGAWPLHPLPEEGYCSPWQTYKLFPLSQ